MDDANVDLFLETHEPLFAT